MSVTHAQRLDEMENNLMSIDGKVKSMGQLIDEK